MDIVSQDKLCKPLLCCRKMTIPAVKILLNTWKGFYADAEPTTELSKPSNLQLKLHTMAPEVNSRSRRAFIRNAGGVSFLIATGTWFTTKSEVLRNRNESTSIGSWVTVAPDGQITILNPAAEMGQGSMTALAIIIAEEMDANWKDVRIENSPIEPDTYGLQWGGQLGGPMITVGSRTVRGYYHALRLAGAQIRKCFVQAAAIKWNTDASEIETRESIAFHTSSEKQLTYGEIASFMEVPESLPSVSENDLKKVEDFSMIGSVVHRYDIPGKVNGTAQYAIDIRVPGMQYAMISRSPVYGARPELDNEDEVRTMDGISHIVTLSHGIGVVGESFEKCLAAKRALKITWSQGNKADGYDSRVAFDEYMQLADGSQMGESITELGDVHKAFSEASKEYHTVFRNDFVYHAQMEPLNAVVSVASDGKSAEAWYGSQAPDRARDAIATELGIAFEDVTVHNCFLGGGFGRRSMSDYVVEATQISEKIKAPVKLVWTREDDVQYGAFRPISLQSMSASVNQKGELTGWKYRIVGTGDGLLASGARVPYYSIPNKMVDLHSIDHGVRTKHWRSVGHGPNKYAIEAFIDQIARDQKTDPFKFRKRLLATSPRELKVLEKVAEMCNWTSAVPEGRGRGMAFAERSGALVAGVAEISVDKETGKIKVHQFWCAMDAGLVVQPDNAIAQLEGGIILGLSSALHESITFSGGVVQQSNFHNYSIARISDTPENIDIHIIPSQENPAGVGEASTPVVGAAIANAFLDLTGKPLTHMPFTPDRVKMILG